jgi:membrane protein
MGPRLGGVAEVGRQTVAEVMSEEVTFIAGSIAYYAFVSLIPILVVASLFLSMVGDAALAAKVVALTQPYLPETAQPFVKRTLTGSDASVTVIGGLALVWGTLKVFRSLDLAFTQIYDTGRHDSFVDRFRDGVVVVVALGLAISTLVVTGLAAAVQATGMVAWVVNTVLTLLGLMVAFYPLYYVFPDVDVSPVGILPGVALAAVGWVVLKMLFGVYVAMSSVSDAYGVVGGVILLVTWLYFSALVLLSGAALNAVLAGRSGNHPAEVAARQEGQDHPHPGHAAVRDADDFDRLLDRLVADARDHGVPEDDIRQSLRRHVEEVAESAD